ncbi:histidinol phosphate phosphatase [bacterium]|nr:MAG: histidinol phosphate phosphatase [bacterium]
MNDDLQQRLDFAVAAAQRSAKLTLEYFGTSDLDQTTKHDGTPVTVADRACETDLRKQISEVYPEDSILGEEFERKVGTSEYEWIIDPIDGTISFVQGVPLFGTMFACMKNGTPVLGVIAMPALNETVYAGVGLGCWHTTNGSDPIRAQVSSVDQLDQSLISTTSMSYFTTPALRKLYEQLDAHAKHTRGWSDCYGWVLLATGRVDAVVEPVLSLWDFAAAIPIINEAGGRCTDLSGVETLESGELVASNGLLQEELIALIQSQDELNS